MQQNILLAKIYKSYLRKVESTAACIVHISAVGAGSLKQVQDILIDPSQEFIFSAAVTGKLLVLPVSGGIMVSAGYSLTTVQPEEIFTLPVHSGEKISVVNTSNHYPQNTLLFIFEEENETTFTARKSAFIPRQMNELLASDTGIQTAPLVVAGIFSSRSEIVYPNNTASVFLYAVNGAFEAEGRLIEARDGLWLKGQETTEAEALSENSVLLLIEIRD